MTAHLETTQKPFSYSEICQQLEEKSRQLEELQEAYQLLQEQLDWLKRQLFGRKSEKHCAISEVGYFPGFEPLAGATVAVEPSAEKELVERKKRQVTYADAIKLPKDIPTEQIYLDVPEKEKICPVTGVALVKIGEEVSTRLCKRPATFYIKQIIRPKYASPIKEADQPIITADLPESFLPGANVDESVLADLCVSKYGDHQPLNRIAEIWGRSGVEISRQTLNEWVLKTAEALAPLYMEMCKEVKKAKALHIDESPIALLRHKKGKAHQAYGWLMVAEVEPEVWYSVYHFKTSREHVHAEDLLEGYKGYVHSDKYEAYEKLAERKAISWCPCWVHIRRNFIEAATAVEVKNHFLKEIRKLFELEKEAWALPEEERCSFRQEREGPLIDELVEFARKRIESGKDLKKSKMAQALNYFYTLKPYLKTYMKSPQARLDNNPVERQVRPMVLGRKNWLFLGSLRGAKAAEVLFSLVQSCRSIGVNPTEYLEEVMRRIGSHPSNRLAELLPMAYAKRRGLAIDKPSSVLFSQWKKQPSAAVDASTDSTV